MDEFTTDPHHADDNCPHGHAWQAGGMFVDTEDVAMVAEQDARPFCQQCGIMFTLPDAVIVEPAPDGQPSSPATEPGEPGMSLADKIKNLRDAGFGMAWVDKNDAARGWVGPVLDVAWEGRYPHPDVSDKGYQWSGHESEADWLPFVDLGAVARGEDRYGQTSSVDRSNFRSLQRDYPQIPWVRITYMNQDGLGCTIDALTDDLIGILCRLATEYPVYDEQDMSALEQDEIYESFDDWFRSEIYDAYGWSMRRVWDACPDGLVDDTFWAGVSADMLGNEPSYNSTEVVWGPVEQACKAFRPLLLKAYWESRKPCQHVSKPGETWPTECVKCGKAYIDGNWQS